MTDENALAGYCGICCENCPVYRLSRDGSEEEQFQFAFTTRCALDQIRCEGCRSSERFVMSKYCMFRRCAKGRGLDACAFCAEFPCETLATFYEEGTPSQREALENSRRMKAIGLDAWLAEADKKCRCDGCGAPLVVGADQCRACGAQKDP